ncbi:MAG: serine hydrolase [Bacteroidales bacterium]|nr:serine hydrolase [Bacteroidales bacterium]
MLKRTFIFIGKIFIFIPLLLGLILFTFPFSYASDFTFSPNGDSAVHNRWVDSVFKTMTPDERVGQLFMVEVSSKWSGGDKLYQNVESYVRDLHVGGVIFFYGGPCREALLINKLQSEAKIPLMVAQDAEWGLGMRLDSAISFPRNLCLGAIENDEIIYEMGREIGRECNRLGVNIDFTPCIDIYDNPANTVIANRSFGSNKMNVSLKGTAVMTGIQDFNVLTTAKHFPGHGNTATDSHEALPVINDSQEKIDSLALYPFKYLIHNGVQGVMVGHLFIPAFDDKDSKTPSSISKNVINDLLINKLNFNGLVFTDALQMKGVSSNYTSGELELKAFEAGVDVLLMPTDCKKAYDAMIEARNSGRITQEEIDRRCRKILLAKKKMGLDKYKPVSINNLYEDLNNDGAKKLLRKIYENAITLVQNKSELLPVRNLAERKIAAVSISKDGSVTDFERTLQKYTDVKVFSISKTAEQPAYDQLYNNLSDYDLVIVGFHDSGSYPSTFGMSAISTAFVDKLCNSKKVIVDLFNSPLGINRFKNYKKISSIVVSYDDSELAREISAQMIFGGLPFLGKLPVDVNETYKEGLQYKTESFRLGYVEPRDVEAKTDYLCQIDSFLNDCISKHAFPGCQVLAAKDGKVFFCKEYGNFTYDDSHPVSFDDLYDLASVTKVISTTPALMRLYDEGKFSPYKTFGTYLPTAQSTNKNSILIKDILLHQAKLQPWVAVSKLAWVNGNFKSDIVSNEHSDYYDVQIDDNLFITKNYKDSVQKIVYRSKLYNTKKYLYSDLGFYLMQWLAEYQFGMRLDRFVEDSIYKPLGAKSLCYNPLEHGISKVKIAPTCYDDLFRKHQIQGYVQDFGAALQGGVSGHAGLFSNANDLAKILQMYLNGGVYGGDRYLESSTIQLFTQKQKGESNRRGFGFDKNSANGEGPASSLVSPLSYGHTGFSGTFVWADPQYNLLFIFLSNRIYPSLNNDKIKALAVRKKVQTLIYKAIIHS